MERLPPGLLYFGDCMTHQLIDDLVYHLQISNEWEAVGDGKNSRKVIQYGQKYNYNNYNGANNPANKLNENNVKQFPPVIEQMRQLLIEKLTADSGPPTNETFNQCIINKYEPGQGISPHIDSMEFGSVIGCFTIISGIGDSPGVIDLSLGGEKYSLVTWPGSLYVMTGDSRYKYKHSMAARKTDQRKKRATRISITFRSKLSNEQQEKNRKLLSYNF